MVDDQAFALYFHIPFCKKKCPYCDFNTYALKNIPEDEYVQSLCKEVEKYAKKEPWKGREIYSIYFGGGTPSILSKENVIKILQNASAHFSISDNVEITLEANPGDLTHSALKKLYAAGVNRLSLGVQSLHNNHLQTLKRWHTAEDATEIFKNARQVGFKNISLDLMFALPNQSMTELEKDINSYMTLEPEHISTYELTIERGTPFFERYKAHNSPLPDQDMTADMHALIIEKLTTHDYNWYEVSNFSKPGFESLHNQAYWTGRNYLGLGAGAHSFYRHKDDIKRFAMLASYQTYIQAVLEGKNALAWSEDLDAKKHAEELLLTGLRTKKGVCRELISKLLPKDEEDKLIGMLKKFEKEKLVSISAEKITASSKGRLLSDSIGPALLDAIS